MSAPPSIHVASCQCQMSLRYSQHFGMYIDTVSLQNFDSQVNFPLDIFDLPQLNLDFVPCKSDSLKHAPKHIRNPDFDPKLTCTPNVSSSIDEDSLNVCTKEVLNVTTSFYNKNHPTKCFCLAKSSKEHVSQEHKNTISNSLALHIGERILWDKKDNTVSLGSQTHKTLNHDKSTLSVMSTNNSLFADNGLRCAAFPYKRKYSTNLHSVLECWIIALNYSDRKYCSLTHVLKNACIKLCPHRLASSACQNYKDKKLVPVKITLF